MFAEDNRLAPLRLDPAVAASLEAQLPQVATRAVAAITEEVPAYAGPLRGELGPAIAQAVQLALGTFLRLAVSEGQERSLQAALDGAYALGRGEARAGRTMDALLAAYRVGARVSWREWASTAVAAGLAPEVLVRFAELVFAYIDQLSAASAAGHRDELETTGRVREQYLDRLARALLAGEPVDELRRRAERADWAPPETLTAVLVPSSSGHGVRALLDPATLQVVVERPPAREITVLLVPDATRPVLLGALRGREAVVGPTRTWDRVVASYHRATRVLEVVPSPRGPVDSEEHLPALVLTADAEALADLRARALAPLAELRPGVADRLAETLRSWLLHQGRRDEVARELVVHPQTVRYRMTQLRELFGERLQDPGCVLELTLALASSAGPGSRTSEGPVSG